MTEAPDSLLMAARKLAEAAGIPWPQVQKTYRALQEEQAWLAGEAHGPASWLPKSSGRNIWAAHPRYLSRLIIALACARDGSGAREAVQWTRGLTPKGRPLHLSEGDFPGLENTFEREMAARLTLADRAASLAEVEFIPEARTVIFTEVDGNTHLWALASDRPLLSPALIRSRGVVDGDLFRALQSGVIWQRPDQAPFRSGPEDDS